MKNWNFSRSLRSIARRTTSRDQVGWSSICKENSTNRNNIAFDEMKSVKISDVHYTMLLDLGKKWRMNIQDLLEEVIQENYNNKKRK